MPTKCGTAPFLSTCLYIIYTLFQLCSQYRTYIHIDKQDIIYNESAQLGRTQQGETLTEVNSLFDQMESVQRRVLNMIFPDTSCELARTTQMYQLCLNADPLFVIAFSVECLNHPINLTAFSPNTVNQL